MSYRDVALASAGYSLVKGTSMKQATRVLVANRPKLMREVILAALANQPDIEIVGEVSDETQILKEVRDRHPDFLVIALDETEERPAICVRVFQERPDLRIIAVASREDRTLYLWASCEIHCADIETSTAGILGAVRDTAECGRQPS